jgi:hypothetical protein
MRNPISMLVGGLLCATLLSTTSCKKDTVDANDVGGDANIPLTEVGSEFSAYVNIAGSDLPTLEMTVINRTSDGRVTFRAEMDMTGHQDSALVMSMVPPEHVDGNGRINTTFDMKFTSEGIVDYFFGEKPWVIARYGDGVGTKYEMERFPGEIHTRTVTEKTGQDDWPFVFFNIKTSKIEQETLPEDEMVERVIYRVNHKFGLVYMELQMRSGEKVKADIVGWNAL